MLKHFCTTTYLFNPQGDKVLLIRHKKLPYFLPPGGHIEENEDYFDSSAREVYEELGIEHNYISYPTSLQPKVDTCVQPWKIQKYTIEQDAHYHYDLLFIGLIDETTVISPGKGESEIYEWFDTNNAASIETTQECKQNIIDLSELLRYEAAQKKAQSNLYVWPRYDDSLKRDLTRFVDGSQFLEWNLGDLYDKVPTDYAKKLGATYGIFTATGTAGLHAALMSLGLKPGDEIIVPSMTFVRAVTPLNHLGLIPIIADIDAATGNITAEAVEANITDLTKAVIVVHMWGVPADIKAIKAICKQRNILLIEDFSHAMFSKYEKGFVGSFGDVSFASLQRKKTVSVGEGGLIVTSNPAIFARLQDITSPGSFNTSDGVDFSGFGLNLRMNPFGAVTAKNLLPKVDSIISDRARSIEVMTGLLKDLPERFELCEIPPYATGMSWYSYKLKLKDVDLQSLSGKKFWKFSDFGYPSILEHPYWSKDTRYFPFCLGVNPAQRTELPGQSAYLDRRVTLNIPTVPASYWTKDMIEQWKQDLV